MNTKRSLLTSCISLLLCIAMLLGTTFAWFTDVASSTGNKIQAGILKLDLLELGEKDGQWRSIKDSKDPIFNHDRWEPGYTDVTILKVENLGNLSLRWVARFSSENELSELAKVIDVYVCPGADAYPIDRQLDSSWNNVGTLDKFINTISDTTYGFLDAGESATLGIALKMQETAGNEYQSLKLGKFDIRIVATQATSEEDSFDNQYDADAKFSDELDFETTASLDQVQTVYGELAQDLVIRYSDSIYAFLPAGVKLADGVTSLKFSGKSVENGSNINLGDGDSAYSYDIHIEGIAEDNTKLITVYLGAIFEKGLGNTSLKLYHENSLMTRVNSVADFASKDQYTYDSATGEVVLYVENFSVFSAVTTTADKWDGEAADTEWYNENDTEFTIENAAQFVGFRDLVDAGNTFAGKTVKLGVDIDLADIPFDPIGFGYYDAETNTRVFMGTFDGGHHTIYKLHQNGWELDPDKTNYSTYTYSTAGAGLFASIKDATIKNLAISGAEIVFECVDMGVVVGYAQGTCHFENIVVTDSNIANYNRYTGGVVGEVSYGVNGKNGYSHTFKNITVDSTVKVSGLWGSFGCGMGGVIGGKWGDATVKMENVISAAEMDVYNDVVSAYQWYAFRGCGMLIGHTEEPYSDGRHSGNATASFLTCENVKVYYGDWVNYHYYEFENQDNATGQRYPWVRAEAGEYCDAFSNIRYGVPTHDSVKVSDLTEEELKEIATDYTPIVFDQLYGADRGMYGTAIHEGVTVSTLADSKTIYVQNNLDWTNLKLHYWYANGEDRWTTINEDGISMDGMFAATEFGHDTYKIIIPAFINVLQISGDNGNATDEILFTDLEDGKAYNLGWGHAHLFIDNTCSCGVTKTEKWTLITDSSELAVGDRIIIVASSADYAISTTQASNNRKAVAITKNNDNTVTINPNVQIITLEEGTVENTFAFFVESGYLYAASTGSNHLKTQTKNNVNGSWSIIISNNEALINAPKSSYRSVIQYNPNNGGESLFSCYAGATQQAISIYKRVEVVVETHNCMEYAEGATCTSNAICTVCGKKIENTMLDHSYDEGVIIVNATCTTPGEMVYTCDSCGDKKTETILSSGHTYNSGVCIVCGHTEGVNSITVAVLIKDYAESNGWKDSKPYYELVMDNNITVTTNQIGNTGKYYENGYNWRMYTASSSQITFTAKAGKILSIKITYTDDNDGGVLMLNETQIDTEEIVIVDASSVTFVTAKGQVRISNIEVVYTTDESGNGDSSEPGTSCEHINTTEETTATCTEAGITTVTCNDCGETVSTQETAALGHTTENGTCERCNEVIGGSTEPTEPEVVLEITKDDFNSNSYAANNNTKTENGYSYTSYQVMNQSSVMQWQKSKGYITIASNDFVKLELKVTAGTYTVTVGGKTVTGTTSNGVTTYDLTGLTGEVKISVGGATGKVDYLKFYK